MADCIRSEKRLFFPRSEFIFRAGEAAEGIYCIYTGSVKAIKQVLPYPEVTIHEALQGEIIGFNSIEGGVYTNSAIALEDTYACFIPITGIYQLLKVLSAATELILGAEC
jgi:CRP-like cAMP-binding protein